MIKEVEFLEKEETLIRKGQDVSKMDTKELLFDHSILHAWAKHNWAKKPDDWTITECEILHDEIEAELNKRGYNVHSPIHRPPREMLKEPDFWEEYWDLEGPERLTFIYDMSAIIPEVVGDSVLEVGCGGGKALEMFAMSGYRAVGIDNNDVPLYVCKKKGLEVYKGDAQNLDFDDNSFDTVFSMHVLEHVDDDKKAIQESLRVAKYRAIHLIPLGKRKPKSHKRIYSESDIEKLAKEAMDDGIPCKIKKTDVINDIVLVLVKNKHIQLKKEEVMLDDILDRFKDFSVSSPHIFIVGSSVEQGKLGNDLDILIRQITRDPVIELRIRKMFPDNIRLHFVYDPVGPHDDYVPLYNWEFKRVRDSKVVKMKKED